MRYIDCSAHRMVGRGLLALALAGVAMFTPATARAQTAGAAPTSGRDATVSLTPSDGLALTAPNDIAQLHVGAVLVMRGSVVDTQITGAEGQVAIRNARLRMDGHVAAPWLQYFVQLEFAGSPALLDASITIAPITAFQFRVGQFLQPFGSEWQPNPAQLLLPESSPVGAFFGLGRDTGLELAGTTDDDLLAYWLTVTMGNPVTLSNELDVRDGIVLGRLELHPFGSVPEDAAPYADGDVAPALSIGVDGFAGTIVRSSSRYDSITLGFTTTAVGRFTEAVGGLDAQFVGGPVSASLQIDGGWRRDADDRLAVGAWGLAAMVQAGVFVWQHVLEVATRWSILEPDFAISGDLFASGELALVVYPVGTHAAASLRYGAAHHDAPRVPGTSLGDEWIHIGTLQVQAYL